MTDLTQGLSVEQAATRIAEEGYNELPSDGPRPPLRIAVDVLREPMFLLLIAAAATYLVLGDVHEAMLLGGSIVFIIGITFYQERKTERALEALRDLASPRALVIRGGERVRIPGREVVRGDLLVLGEGDRIPADGILRSVNDLLVDESLLTGESVSVGKVAATGSLPAADLKADNASVVYSGTLVVRGQAVAEVQETGVHAALGKIGAAMKEVDTERTPLQRELGRLAQVFAVIGLVVCVLVIVIYGVTRGDWLSAILVGITLAMSLLPEEIPVVLTVFLALGAWRIANHQVLTRRVPAIEVLGAATVLCVDKTGTLTLNRMSVARLYAKGTFISTALESTALESTALESTAREGSDDEARARLPEAFDTLTRFGVLASEPDTLDPTERAIVDFGRRRTDGSVFPELELQLVHEYPLTPEFPAMTHGWEDSTGNKLLATKGAPEAVFTLCQLSEQERAVLTDAVTAMATDGLRVLGVACGAAGAFAWPATQQELDLRFLGLIGLADPVRPTAPAAVEECRTAGIRVIMMTGDYPVTASAIARQIHLEPADQLLTGSELDEINDVALRERVRTINIFARLAPMQKLRLVSALKANGEIVAMTGDGVNDAPALKAAHIGIAMGSRGTDVAREAASLVLVDDDFAAIVHAVRSGRHIFTNLRKAMAYICSVHVSIAGIALAPVLFNWPLVLLPIHVVFLELIIDPACSIVFEAEPEELNVMRRPPRDAAEPLFGAGSAFISLLQGAGVLVALLLVFAGSLARGADEPTARAIAFTALVVGNLGLIYVNHTWTLPAYGTFHALRQPLVWVTAGALSLLVVALFVPAAQDLFRFAPLSAIDLAVAIGAGLVGVLWLEPLRPLLKRRFPRSRAYPPGASGVHP